MCIYTPLTSPNERNRHLLIRTKFFSGKQNDGSSGSAAPHGFYLFVVQLILRIIVISNNHLFLYQSSHCCKRREEARWGGLKTKTKTKTKTF